MINPVIPRAYGQTSILNNGTAQNNTVVIYTVPAGKVFYLAGGYLAAICDAAAIINTAHLECDAGSLIHLIVATSALVDRQVYSVPLCLSIALPFPAGTVFQLRSDSVNVRAVGAIFGWEESV